MRSLIRFTLVAAMLYLMFGLGCAALQDKIVFPGSMTQGHPDAVIRAAPGIEIVHLTLADGTPIVARFSPAHRRVSNEAPTVLFFYGNGMCAAHADDVLEMLRDLGCNVLCPDYAGYGMSGGKPSEAAFYATADAAYAHLKQRTDINPDRLLVFGLSIGGAVAIDLASREPLHGLITLSTFTSLKEMGREAFPWLPTSWMLSYRFDNLAKIPQVKAPTLIAHGERDSIVPASMSRRLIEKAGGPVQTLFIADANHNDIFLVGGDELRDKLADFLVPFQR